MWQHNEFMFNWFNIVNLYQCRLLFILETSFCIVFFPCGLSVEEVCCRLLSDMEINLTTDFLNQGGYIYT